MIQVFPGANCSVIKQVLPAECVMDQALSTDPHIFHLHAIDLLPHYFSSAMQSILSTFGGEQGMVMKVFYLGVDDRTCLVEEEFMNTSIGHSSVSGCGLLSVCLFDEFMDHSFVLEWSVESRDRISLSDARPP